jgi:uncharacterized alkaline shock family protein YloU
MSQDALSLGKTTVAIDVLETIARLTTLSVPGVIRFSRIQAPKSRGIFHRAHDAQGVLVEVEDDTIFTDLYIVLQSDLNIREVCRTIQTEVARAFSEMIGLQVGAVNVHVEDIEYPDGA